MNEFQRDRYEARAQLAHDTAKAREAEVRSSWTVDGFRRAWGPLYAIVSRERPGLAEWNARIYSSEASEPVASKSFFDEIKRDPRFGDPVVVFGSDSAKQWVEAWFASVNGTVSP